mgnify:CR=1 FL=1
MKTRIWFKRLFCFALAIVFGSALILARVQWDQSSKLFVNVKDVGDAPVALVLGASVRTDGTPSDALRDRVETAVELYKQGKVRTLFMTGDDGKFHVDEVSAMKKVAVDAGVPEDSIQTDGHGYRTYESCKRAVGTFNVRDAVIVTQRYHLGRATYLCHAFGMKVQGLAADKQSYQRIAFFTLREALASMKAWMDINLIAPQPPVAYEK